MCPTFCPHRWVRGQCVRRARHARHASNGHTNVHTVLHLEYTLSLCIFYIRIFCGVYNSYTFYSGGGDTINKALVQQRAYNLNNPTRSVHNSDKCEHVRRLTGVGLMSSMPAMSNDTHIYMLYLFNTLDEFTKQQRRDIALLRGWNTLLYITRHSKCFQSSDRHSIYICKFAVIHIHTELS